VKLTLILNNNQRGEKSSRERTFCRNKSILMSLLDTSPSRVSLSHIYDIQIINTFSVFNPEYKKKLFLIFAQHILGSESERKKKLTERKVFHYRFFSRLFPHTKIKFLALKASSSAVQSTQYDSTMHKCPI
jgi:hypothetical protein